MFLILSDRILQHPLMISPCPVSLTSGVVMLCGTAQSGTESARTNKHHLGSLLIATLNNILFYFFNHIDKSRDDNS